MELTLRYARFLRREDGESDAAEEEYPLGGIRVTDRMPNALIRRLLEKTAIGPAQGTPAEHLYRSIGLWSGLCLPAGLVIFLFHVSGVLPGGTGPGMIITLFLYAIGGAVLFFLNQSGDWPRD